MTPHEATRTLVKSPPEVWAQCSEAEALERHLSGSFGEIRITRLEPETAVAWEGEQARGTVRIEPSAWGTRVTLTAQLAEEPSPPAEPVEASPIPSSQTPPAAAVSAPRSDVAAGPGPPPDAAAAEAVRDPAPPLTAARDSQGLWARLTKRFRAARLPPEPAGPPPVPSSVAPPPTLSDAPSPTPPDIPSPSATGVPSTDEAPAASDTPDATTTSATPGASARPDPVEILNAALDSLGQAHHRPFSRA